MDRECCRPLIITDEHSDCINPLQVYVSWEADIHSSHPQLLLLVIVFSGGASS